MDSIIDKFLKIFRQQVSLTGFTLLEALVIVVIIGSVFAISLPRFRGTFNNLKFDNFCQNLTSRMKYLQERASVEQGSYRLDFDLKNKIINILAKEDLSIEFTAAKGLLGRSIKIPEDIVIEIENPEIFFYPDGSIDGGDFKILGDQNEAVVSIKDSLGRVELVKEKKE